MIAVHLNRKEDDFLSGYSKLETPDERIEHKVEGSLLFDGHEELIKQYEKILATNNSDGIMKELLPQVTTVLKPEQINSFLQATVRYEDNKKYEEYTGLFITRLIQNSPDAGNNKFTFNTQAISRRIEGIGFKLIGKEERALEIIIDGNIGEWSCSGAKNIREIYISGNAGSWCGDSAHNIERFSIMGDVGSLCGYGAMNIKEFYIVGDAGHSCGSWGENLAFKTPNKQTLQLLKENVPKGKNNKIYFIHPNNQEEEIKIW
ncbi:MAG: hypothetical protein ABIB71_03675 [Candidatus Woesearchaeota archaeon]